MLTSKTLDSSGIEIGPRLIRQRRILHWGRILSCLVATIVLTSAALPAQAPLPSPKSPDRPSTNSVANSLPDKNDQMKMSEEQARKHNLNASNTEDKRQVAADSANLLKLATELKAEVDKTNKDMLSITVIRKADAIEKLARQVKEKMKLTVGAN